MPDANGAADPAASDPESWSSRHVRALVTRLQAAHCGTRALDVRVADVLARAAGRMHPAGATAIPVEGGVIEDGPRWSSDLNQVLTLIPDHYNFSMGQRDGVCWAWIQPNDDWEPGENEARHDHPRGSGLVVAHTATLAVLTATILLETRHIDARAA